jgi:GNAT superfamily N-acetyltransferase
VTFDVTVEPARAENAAAWVVLRGQTRENPISADRLATLGVTAEGWARDVEQGVLIGLEARQGDRLLGYAFGDRRSGEVVVLALRPEAEGQGLGRRLLQGVMNALLACGHRRLFLGADPDPRVRAHGFYRHLGWRPAGALDPRGDEVLEWLTPAEPTPPGPT